MKRIRPLCLLATALVAVACVRDHQPADRGDERLALLGRAFRLQESRPERAAELFAAAGSGSFLETARVEAWLRCLEAGEATPAAWRGFLAGGPPPELAARARAALGRILIAAGDESAAAALLLREGSGPAAWAVLIQATEPSLRLQAAHSLAVAAPRLLRQLAPALEAQAVAGLTPDESLERARQLIGEGSPQRAARELAGRRFDGPLEASRQLVLAEAEIGRGRPAQALRILPSGRRANPEQSLVRAEAYRRQAWSRHPSQSAGDRFLNCARAAERAVPELEGEARARAVSVAMECWTEAGQPRRALALWRNHRSEAAQSARFEWVGRRLGVALAWQGEDPEAVLELARALPDHERCLRFWAGLARVEDSPIPDLYARWLMDEGADPVPVELGAELEKRHTPPSVAWLNEAGAAAEAAREWQRLARMRALTPVEALTAAEFEHRRGRPDLAVRVLRRVFPELGQPAMARLPSDVLRAYLPLRYAVSLREAAAENGLDPWLVAGLARQESLFVPYARSPRGALGVLQLIPTTARGHARALGLGSRPDLTDPHLNLRLGARELAALINDFGALEPALAAYNAGPTRARRWWRLWPDRARFSESIPIPETYTYVRRVSFLAEAYRRVYAREWSTTP